MTFEHAWGDGVAVLRFLNETLGENFDEPILVEPCTENTESSSWSLLEFELDEKSEHDILTAKTEYRRFCKLVQNCRVNVEIEFKLLKY